MTLESIRVDVGATVDELEELEEWIGKGPSPLLAKAREVWLLSEAAVHSQLVPRHQEDLALLSEKYREFRIFRDQVLAPV